MTFAEDTDELHKGISQLVEIGNLRAENASLKTRLAELEARPDPGEAVAFLIELSRFEKLFIGNHHGDKLIPLTAQRLERMDRIVKQARGNANA